MNKLDLNMTNIIVFLSTNMPYKSSSLWPCSLADHQCVHASTKVAWSEAIRPENNQNQPILCLASRIHFLPAHLEDISVSVDIVTVFAYSAKVFQNP